MDDCDLTELLAPPALLQPKFNKNVLEYESTVPSSVEEVKFSCLTSDTGASYQVVGNNGEKTVPLKAGKVNEIRIEVSAEDGTTKNYYVRIKRLSPSDASLKNLTISNATIRPQFSPDCVEYFATVPVSSPQVIVTATPPEEKCVVAVENSEDKSQVTLPLSETRIKVTIASADGSQSKDYFVMVQRKQLPWPIYVKDKKLAKEMECPMMLTPMYNPVAIAGSNPKTVMSKPCVDALTRRSKVNPLTGESLPTDWRVIDSELDAKINAAIIISPYYYRGCTEDVSMSSVGQYIKSDKNKPTLELDINEITETEWYKSAKPLDLTQHKVEVRNWERRLQQMAVGGKCEIKLKEAEENMKCYWSKLPTSHTDTLVRDEEKFAIQGELREAAISYAACIGETSSYSSFHLQLGHVLEEQHYLKEIYGIGLESDKVQSTIGASGDDNAKESSKMEECLAICALKGVLPGSPIAEQLKAIDSEYKSLLEAGQSGRADHVQGLYAWRSKEANKDMKTALQFSDQSDLLTQAHLKYMDAMKKDKKDFYAVFHAGRLKTENGLFSEAVEILQHAIILDPKSAEARFLLGYALCSQTDVVTGVRRDEAVKYLHQGLEQWLQRRFEEADHSEIPRTSKSTFHCEDLWRISNIFVYRAFFLLADELRRNPKKDYRTSQDILHIITLNVSSAICSSFTRKSDLFKQLEWILLTAHHQLIEILTTSTIPINIDIVDQRCKFLSAMIRSSSLPRDTKLINFQKKVSQQLVLLNPCDSESLRLLGSSQLSFYDSFPQPKDADPRFLTYAIDCFEASLALEGKPAAGEAPKQIQAQQWWIDHAASKVKPPPPVVAGKTSSTQTSTKTLPKRGGKTATPTVTAATSRKSTTTPSTRGRGRGTNVRASRGRVAAPTNNKAAVRVTAKTTPSGKIQQPAAKSTGSVEKSESETMEKNIKPSEEVAVVVTAKLNNRSFLTRLGLARALNKTEDRKSEARQIYEQVIDMAPEHHDAYIELAEILVVSDPLAAVDLYCKFPCSGEDKNFDDAFISGEVVHILMKEQKYDDPRLLTHMVKWGQIMGFGILDRHVATLEAQLKNDLLRKVYCGINHKSEDDSEVVQFFKFKCWI